MTSTDDAHWVETGTGHAIALDEAPGGLTVVARNAKGRPLKSVPPAVKKTEAYAQVDAALTWLRGHENETAGRVEAWLLRSQPVPLELLTAVWPDPTWRAWLVDLVVMPAGDDALAGFLRSAEGATAEHGPRVGVVDLDGESVWLDAPQVRIPHPALLPDLDDLREFAAEIGVEQRFNQLHRDVHRLPDPLPAADVTSLDTWAGAEFEQLRHAAHRAVAGGFAVKGGFAVARVHEQGRLVEASLWIGAEYPEAETELGDLAWYEGDRALPVREVGPVAYSEGVRMAEWLYAGRKVEEPGEKEQR